MFRPLRPFVLILISLFALPALSHAQSQRNLPEPLHPENAAEEVPRLYPFLPADVLTSCTAIIICPGGGYAHLSMEKEGFAVADWLNALGVAAFVLEYRHDGNVTTGSTLNHYHPAPLDDAQWAIRAVRAGAKKWKINPERVGMMGFSAGGHLAATAGTHFAEAGVSDRPDFLILAYPVISLTDELAHKGSRSHLLGQNPDPKLVLDLSNELKVTPRTPPAFIVSGGEDKSVNPLNSMKFFEAMRGNKVPVELHIFDKGGHGFGLAQNTDDPQSQWPALCAAWLRARHLAPMPPAATQP